MLQGKEKTNRQEIMLDTVYQSSRRKKNDPKQQEKEKTYKQMTMLDTVQPEQQNKTNDRNNKEKRKHTGRR